VGRTGPARRARDRLADPVWVLLWGTFTPLSIVGGVVVAVAVIGAFRFPPAEAHLPVRPLRLLGLVVYLVYDMVVSGAEVSWQVLRTGPPARRRGVRGCRC
jgi:multicomponent Na+:H+ antiporter subunit E